MALTALTKVALLHWSSLQWSEVAWPSQRTSPESLPKIRLQISHTHSIIIGGPACAVCCMQVTLLIPWLKQEDQALVFHGKHSFEQPEEQTECIKDWIRKRTGFEANFKIQYYPGRYDTSLLGIFPIGDLTVYIPVEEVRLHMLGQAHSPTHAQIQLFTLGARRRPDAGSLSCTLCQDWQSLNL